MEWISIEDYLPEDGRTYIASSVRNGICFLNKNMDSGIYYIKYLFGNNYILEKSDVTHWLDLPEA